MSQSIEILTSLASPRGQPVPPGEGIIGPLRGEVGKDGIVLVPLRVFIGLGWLRAFAEKASDSAWWDGAQPATFLTERVARGEIALPPYEALVTDLFLPHAAVLAWILMLGQLLAGIAILTGTLTNAALLGGLFMNLNFLFAGAPDPSAFYVVIQAALLLAGAGAILGIDGRLGTVVRHPLLTARPATAGRPGFDRRWPAATAALALSFAAYALTQVSDWTPAGSVHDPAMILAILAGMTAGWSVIAWLRSEALPHRVPAGDHLHDRAWPDATDQPTTGDLIEAPLSIQASPPTLRAPIRRSSALGS